MGAWVKAATAEELPLLDESQVMKVPPTYHHIAADQLRTGLDKFPSIAPYHGHTLTYKEAASYYRSLASAFTHQGTGFVEVDIDRELADYRQTHSEEAKKEVAEHRGPLYNQNKLDALRAYQRSKGRLESEVAKDRGMSVQKLWALFENSQNEADRAKIARQLCRPNYQLSVTPKYLVTADPATSELTIDVSFVARTHWRPSALLTERFKPYLPEIYFKTRQTEQIMGRKLYVLRVFEKPLNKTVQVHTVTTLEKDPNEMDVANASEDLNAALRLRAELVQKGQDYDQLMAQYQSSQAQLRLREQQLRTQTLTINRLQADQDMLADAMNDDEVPPGHMEVQLDPVSIVKDIDFIFTRPGKLYQCPVMQDLHYAGEMIFMECGHFIEEQTGMALRLQNIGAGVIPETHNGEPVMKCYLCQQIKRFRTCAQIHQSLTIRQLPFGDNSLVKGQLQPPLFTTEQISKKHVNIETFWQAILSKGDIEIVDLYRNNDCLRRAFAQKFRASAIGWQNYWRNRAGSWVDTILALFPA